jgi:nucleosome binding factor SPN SPT16 subunit
MIGKKKTKDVQFYREVGDASFDETGNKKRRYNYGDEDELDSEQNERKARNRLNKEFKEFANTINEMSKGLVEVDTPFRDLGFHGVPHRQLVLLQPSTDCLVHLTDNPFLVVTIADIEIAHLEIVQFGLKNFDMVFVFKDFTKTPIHINTIPMKQLDNVKEWLDSVDVPFSEGPVNLSWGQIMKTINDDPGVFFSEGGWSFLSGESDGMSDMSESASEFDMDSSVAESASSEDSDASDFSGSGSEDGSEDMSGSGSGEDWDELEKKAGRSDQKKREKEMDSDDDHDDHRKKVRR